MYYCATALFANRPDSSFVVKTLVSLKLVYKQIQDLFAGFINNSMCTLLNLGYLLARLT